MRKICVYLMLSLFFLPLTISCQGFADEQKSQESGPQIKDTQTSPDIYDPENVYYLVSPTYRSPPYYLSGLPHFSDGSNPDLNKIELVNGAIYTFYWPLRGKKATTLIANPRFLSKPFISLTLNTLEDPSKSIVVSIGIDTNNYYDPHVPETLEHRCNFPAYITTGGKTQQSPTMEEELYEAFGTWEGAPPPAVITNARVVFEITMTSPNGNHALLYCGFDYKASWFAIRYMHNELQPHANIVEESKNQGFIELGKDSILAGERVFFDASASFDPLDDYNRNNRIDTGETDRLLYKWDWGDGTATKFDYGNRQALHIYQPNKIPKKAYSKVFMVNLTVKTSEGRIDWETTLIQINRSITKPEISLLKINNITQYPLKEGPVILILTDRVEVFFSAEATDPDGDELFYYWDLDGNSSNYEVSGDKDKAGIISYVFSQWGFNLGEHVITLVVSDDTLADNASLSCTINFVNNMPPVASIKARLKGEFTIFNDEIKANLNQRIIFDASDSFDPDNLPGFDENGDGSADSNLRFRWNFDIFNALSTSGWVPQKVYEYRYSTPGRYEYFVTVDVDDGSIITTSAPFKVIINAKPVSMIRVDAISYDLSGEFSIVKPLYFNGTSSYDPNGDKIINYTWTIGFGDFAITKFGSVISHQFEISGVKSISLMVFDGEFWSDEYSIKIEIPKIPNCEYPTYYVYPLVAFTYEDVTFEVLMDRVQQPYQRDLKIKLDFGDSTSSVYPNKNVITHWYDKPGHYLITITFEYNSGLTKSYNDIIVTIKNRPPVAKLPEITPKGVGELVRLSGDGSYDLDGEIVSYIWMFGDGTSEIITNQSQVEHKWGRSGKYTVSLVVHDDLGSTDEVQLQVILEDRKIEIDENYPQIMLWIIIVLFNVLTIAILIKLVGIYRIIKQKRH